MSSIKTAFKSNNNLSGLMKKPTILKVFSILYIFVCIGFLIFNWATLTEGEGWGMVYMIGLLSVGFLGLVIDLILLKLIKVKWIFHLIEIFLILFFSMELWMELKNTLGNNI